ncbi:MAG: hypothetical protein MUC81_01130 [Bacteroidia bacterium]|jgi:hypothetical protein|nr:hypothetical protein [Bacteroidia bacterium]
MPSFYTQKYYADLQTDNNEHLIVYVAKIKWGIIQFTYSGYCLKSNLGVYTEVNRFNKPLSLKKESNFKISFDELQGSWNPLDKPIDPQELYRDGANLVSWDCFAPLCDAEVIIEGKTYKGLGYAEVLETTIAPWKLPIKELYWGRAINSHNHLVWIVWKGKHPIHKAWLNGKEQQVSSIELNDLFLADGTSCSLQKATPLRRGEVGKTIFKTLSILKYLFPIKAFRITEEKFVGIAHAKVNLWEMQFKTIFERALWP